MKFRRLLTGLLIAAVSGLISILLAEVGLRVAGYSAPIFRKADSDLGWSLYPGMRGWHKLEQKNFHSINDQGFNSELRPKEKSAGTYRIAVVGDSFVQAGEVAREANFVSGLEQILNDQSSLSDRVEVLNFGVVGYSPSQMLLMLEKQVFDYDPDLVIVVFFVGNDISDNSISLATSLPALRPYFHRSGSELIQDENYPDKGELFKNGLIIEVVNLFRIVQLLKEFSLRRHGTISSDKVERPLTDTDQVYLESASQDWKTAWEITEALTLDMFKKVTCQSKRRFLFVTIPDPIEAHPDKKLQQGLLDDLGIEHFDYPRQRFSALSVQHDIPYLPLGDKLSAAVKEHGKVLFGFEGINSGFGHLNREGHRAVASLIASYFVDSRAEWSTASAQCASFREVARTIR